MTLSRDAIIGFVTLTIIVALAFWYVIAHPPTSVSTARQTDTPTHVADKGEYYTIDADYPSVTPLVGADADAKAVGAMKTYLAGSVISDFKNSVDGNNQLIQELKAKGEEIPASFQNLYLNITYKMYQSHRTVSYVFQIEEYTGGAHPNGFYTTFVFDTKTGTKLLLPDLFASGTTYLDFLSTYSRAKLLPMIAEREQVDVSQVDPQMLTDGTTPKDENFQNFYFDGSNFVLLFSPYAVGPYVLGSLELPIPTTDIPGLKPDYTS